MISLITTLKKTRAALAEQRQEVEKWSQRVTLAREKGRADLIAQAEQRVQEAEQTLNKLHSEEQEVMREFRETRAKYKIESMLPEKSIDPDRLLAALQSVAGKPDSLQEELNRTAVDEQLTALKKELQGGSSNDNARADESGGQEKHDKAGQPGASTGPEEPGDKGSGRGKES